MSSLLRLERKQNNYWNPFLICIFLFLSLAHLRKWNDKCIHTFRSSLENHARFQTKMVSGVYPFSDQNGAKTLPDWGGGGAHTSMAYIKEYPPGQKTGPLVLEFNFKDALYIFRKIANIVTYISHLRIRTHVWATQSRSFYIERRFALTNRRASVWKLWLQRLSTIPYCFFNYWWLSSRWLIYWHLKK